MQVLSYPSGSSRSNALWLNASDQPLPGYLSGFATLVTRHSAGLICRGGRLNFKHTFAVCAFFCCASQIPILDLCIRTTVGLRYYFSRTSHCFRIYHINCRGLRTEIEGELCHTIHRPGQPPPHPTRLLRATPLLRFGFIAPSRSRTFFIVLSHIYVRSPRASSDSFTFSRRRRRRCTSNHHGRIRPRPDLWHDLRDHQQVRQWSPKLRPTAYERLTSSLIDTPTYNPWEWVPLVSFGMTLLTPIAGICVRDQVLIVSAFSSAKDQLTGSAVAVKKIMKPFSTPVLSKRTYRELKLLKHLRHENVCAWRLRGI